MAICPMTIPAKTMLGGAESNVGWGAWLLAGAGQARRSAHPRWSSVQVITDAPPVRRRGPICRPACQAVLNLLAERADSGLVTTFRAIASAGGIIQDRGTRARTIWELTSLLAQPSPSGNDNDRSDRARIYRKKNSHYWKKKKGKASPMRAGGDQVFLSLGRELRLGRYRLEGEAVDHDAREGNDSGTLAEQAFNW